MAIQELIQVLRDMKDIHQSLLDIAQLKKETLINNQVDQLNGLVIKESKLVKQIAELEQKRVFEIGRFLVGKGYKPDPAVTVSDLSRIVFKAEDKQALLDAQQELAVVLGQLQRANQVNQELARNSLAFIDYTLNLLIGAEDDSVYQHPQQQAGGYKRNSYFDTKA
ncbi:flagellar protein FlgN [Paenibacillus turpanensis]|uniref:flagellar protein FlgN n=1 Tax=Paenibacillus turpanensis TaxID=2689078 RepID=UPI00140C631E|nr:flagellar protein FlgN [Paenibacillus turpanensis]